MGYPSYPEHPTNTVQRIYVASSWRNEHQPAVVEALRGTGFEVYDFRHPRPDNEGFGWSEIDPDWQRWTPETYRDALGLWDVPADVFTQIEAQLPSGVL